MPVAESFNALGKGNGFASCLTKLDISASDYWTSLSGWSKVNTPAGDVAKAESIAESRRLAMLFYWNSYKLNAKQTNLGIPTGFPEQANSKDHVKKPGTAQAQDELTPKSRVCRVDNYIQTQNGLGEIRFEPFNISRLYNGEITDEQNFVGFGLGDLSMHIDEGTELSFIDLSSQGDDEVSVFFDTGYSELPIIDSDETLHCVCYIASREGGQLFEFDTANRRLREFEDDLSFDLITEISSIELYTYS